MSPEYQEYYQQLLTAFHSHNDSNRTEMERIEACFKSSLDYWGEICKQVRRDGFCNREAEIHFFKVVKPAFTAYIEYYTYRYHALLFLPAGDLVERKRFWKWEERKIERFYENNREFCVYMKKGDTSRDAEYFLRGACSPGENHLANSLAYELDENLISPKDHLVTLLKAYVLYEEYIRNFIYINHSNFPP